MHVHRFIRNAPVRAAVRLKTRDALHPEAGMTTAEYAVGTVDSPCHR